MNMKALVVGCLIVFFFSSLSVKTQTNFISAKLINNTGDTIKGFVNYQEWERNPKTISFKTSEKESPVNYGPTELHSFMVENDYYESRVIEITDSPRKAEQLSYNKVYEKISDTVFILVLVKGNTNLYQYTDAMATEHFYLETNDGELHELIYYKYLDKENGVKVIRENPKFSGQLSYLLQDCADLKKSIWNVKYNATELIKLVNEYNNCRGQENLYVHKTVKNKMRFGIIAGVTLTKIDFEYIAGWTYLNNGDFDNSLFPTIGATFELMSPRARGKWSWYSDLLIKSHYYKSSYTEFINEDYYIDYDLSLGSTYLKYTTLGRFHIVGHKLVPYISAGLFFSGLLTYQNEKVVDKHFYDSHTITTSEIFGTVRGFDYGLVAGIGLKFHDFNVDVRYDIGGISTYGGYSSKTQTFYFLLGYMF